MQVHHTSQPLDDKLLTFATTHTRSSDFPTSTFQDFSPSISRLQETLDSVGALGDEKVWVDRPVSKDASVKDEESSQLVAETDAATVIDQAIQQIKELRAVEGDSQSFKQRVDEILNSVFLPIDKEVMVVPRHVDELLPKSNSLLDVALRQLDAIADQGSSERSVRAKKIAAMARDALTSYSFLYRNLSTQLLSEGGGDARQDDPVYRIENLDYASDDSKRLRDFLTKSAGAAFRAENETGDAKNSASFFVDKLADWPHRSLERGRSSLIPMPKPVLVPGGRFVEGYYWDTYWIIRGLCVAGKTSEALDMLDNFFSAIDRFGFIPNGFRQYYLDRSQPPVLSQSVRVVHDTLEALGQNATAERLLRNAVPRLLEEYFSFWMNPAKGHVVVLNDKGQFEEKETEDPQPQSFSSLLEHLKNGSFILNRYFSAEATFRPESYMADKAVIMRLKNDTKIDSIMRSIRSAAESGWDFSLRWSRRYFAVMVPEAEDTKHISSSVQCRNPNINDTVLRRVTEYKTHTAETWSHSANFFRDLDTIHIAPVDLNALMYQFEKNLFYFINRLALLPDLADMQTALQQYIDYFELAHKTRAHTMAALMRDNELSVWKDLDIVTGRRSCVVSAASAVPVWAGLEDFVATRPDSGQQSESGTVKSVSLPPNIFKGWGIIPTPYESGQQWDFPNVWPPLIHFVIEVLDRQRAPWDFKLRPEKNDKLRSTPAGFKRGLKLAQNFIHASLLGYTKLKNAKQPGYFYEKFDTTDPSRGGDGGEYENQVGFGWTNGVILELVSRYRTLLV